MPHPVFRGGTAREQIERETRLGHEGGEPTDPPPPPSVEQDLDDPLDQTRVAREVGFRSGVAHIRAAIERMSKPVAVMLAAWGTISWVGSVAWNYWTTDHVVSVDRYAKDEAERTAELNRRDRDIEGLRSTVNDMREQMGELRGMAKARQQQPIQNGSAPDMTRPPRPGEKGNR